MKSSFAILSSLTLAHAQESSTIVSMFGILGGGYSASVITADASITTLQLVCPTATAPDEDLACFDSTLTVTTGSNTFGATIADGGATGSIGCSLGGTTTAECTQVYTSTDEPSISPDTQIVQLTADDFTWVPVTITGGLDMLSGGAEASPTPTDGGAESSADATGSAGPSETSGTGPSGTSAAGPSETTGAASKGIVSAGAALGAFGAFAAALAL